MVNLPRLFQRRAAVRPRMLTATDGRDILLNDPAGWEVNQPWLWWLGPANGNGTGGPFGNPPPGADDPFGYVSLPAVQRATGLICDTIAALDWNVYRGEYEKLPTPSWISDPQNLNRDGRNPNERGPEMISVRLSAFEFWCEALVHALWFGDAFIYVPQRDSSGQPLAPLWHLNPHKLEIEDGRYWVDDEEMPAANLIHLRGKPPYKHGRGTGVLDEHGLDLALAMQVRSYAASQYASGIPYGYLKSSQPRMDEPQAVELKQKWMETHGTSRRSIAVLNATTEFIPLTISPLDAQLADARTWSLRDVALAFGVPPYMLGVSGDTSTYANVEGRNREFLTYTLAPHIKSLESTLSAQLPLGTNMRVETFALLRADTQTRFAAYQTALQNGFMTVNEVRARENLEPLEEAPSPIGMTKDANAQPNNGSAEG